MPPTECLLPRSTAYFTEPGSREILLVTASFSIVEPRRFLPPKQPDDPLEREPLTAGKTEELTQAGPRRAGQGEPDEHVSRHVPGTERGTGGGGLGKPAEQDGERRQRHQEDGQAPEESSRQPQARAEGDDEEAGHQPSHAAEQPDE